MQNRGMTLRSTERSVIRKHSYTVQLANIDVSHYILIDAKNSQSQFTNGENRKNYNLKNVAA